MEENKVNLVLEPHQRPKSVFQWITLSLQHVFAMFGATILVPMIINATATNSPSNTTGESLEAINISMALFCAGIGTLIYIAFTAAKVPVYLGSSFAYMTVMGVGFADWGNAIFIAVFCVGLVYMLMGFIIYWTGIQWIKKAFSPIVIGPIVIIIGLSAVTSALGNVGLTVANIEQGYDSSMGDDNLNIPRWLAMMLGLLTFLIAGIFMLKAKSFLKVIPILASLLIGYIFVLILHFILNATTDISLVNTSLITDTSRWQWYPSFKAIWDVNPSNIAPAIVAIVPIALVTMVEHLGDHINIGTLTNKDFLKDPGVHKTLFADGVAMSFAGLIGGPANATYSENTSVVGITKVASVWVTGLAACMAVIMSFIAPVNQLILMIPKPVLGGISIMLFGMIASNGVKIMLDGKVDFRNAKNLIVVSIILAVGIGMAVTGQSITLGGSFTITGLFLATILGVILNLILPDQDNLGLITFFKKNKDKKNKKD